MSPLYKSLESSEIRLLTVDFSSKLNLRLRTYLRRDAPDYDAVSYTWGDDASSIQVSCNDSHLEIRSNLLNALPQISESRPEPHRPLWIDAICLNQADHEEKAVHVPLMGEIYENAKRTLVWLGDAADDSDLAMDSLPGLLNIVQTMEPNEFRPHVSAWPDILLKYRLPAVGEPVWHALQALFSRQWFYRLWTLQEVVLARDPIVLCGSRYIDWNILPLFAKAVTDTRLSVLCFKQENSESTGAHTQEPIQFLTQIHDMRTRLRPLQNAMFLCTLISFSNNRGYRDPVDRVWALMGLLSKASYKILQEARLVDFTPEAKENYHETYLAIVKVHVKRLPNSAMAILEHGLTHARHPLLPSWCPDWNRKQICTPIAYVPGAAAGRPDGLAATTGPIRLLRPIMSVEGDSLSVLGLPLDTIRYVSQDTGKFGGSYVTNGDPDWMRMRLSQMWNIECLNIVAAVTDSAHHEVSDDQGIQLWNKLQESLDNLHAMLFPWMKRLNFDMSNFVLWCNSRKFFGTDCGRFGIGHPDIKQGDVLCAMFGGVSLFILRPVERSAVKQGQTSRLHLDLLPTELFEVIGDAYVPDLMHGEGFRERSCEDMMHFRLR
jgi:hypothetical protein